MRATIYHNPQCGTSRNVLALLRHFGIEPQVVHYLETPPDVATLGQLIAEAGISVRAAIREKESVFKEAGLDNAELSDDELLEAMVRQPILINRPIVVTELGCRLARPSEVVLQILPQIPVPPFSKEDGEVVIGAGTSAID